MPGFIGEILRLTQQIFPLAARQAAFIEIGSCPFTAMIEEAPVVVTLFQGLDLVRDEAIKCCEIGRQVIRQ